MSTDHITHYADTRGDDVAIVDDRPTQAVRSLDFAGYNAEINRLANGLIGLGVQPGEHVAWWGPNSLESMAAIHACRKAGVTSVPIPYRSTADEAHYLLDNAGAVAVVVEAPYAPLVADLQPRLAGLRSVIVYGGDPAVGQHAWAEVCTDPTTPPTEGTVAETHTMIYTSGTTGQPKGAVRKTGGAVGAAPALMAHIGWPDMERLWFLTTGPLYHSGPSGFALRAQALGGTVVTQHRFDAEDWLRLVDTHQVTATFSAPTPIRRICALPDEIKARYDVSSLSSMVANAAPWTMTLKEAYLRDFREDSLWEVYGSTELSVVTALAPEDQLRKPGSCGVAAPGVEVRLYDDDGTEITDTGVPGELYARSPALFETYHNAHDRYLDDHRDGFQTVGDIAYRDDEGYLYICDRKKDMIITGGVNVYPAEVENVLDAHPDIHEVAVLGVADEEWGEAVCAVVVAEPGRPVDPDGIVAYAAERLSGPKRPKRVVVVDELPKTGTGKVLKRALRDTIA